ncbi:hypothetical protein [Paenibacillus sp. B1-33]
MPIWAETPPTKQLAMTMPRKNGENNIPPIVWAISLLRQDWRIW